MADPKDKDKKQRTIEEIGALIGEAIIIAADSPDSGQRELTPEEKEKIKARVGEAFNMFMEHREWKDKTDPVINNFRKAMLPKLLKHKLEKKVGFDEAVKEVFPTLDPEFEGHAVLNLIANLLTVGRFKKLKEDTQAMIVEDEYMIAGLVIQYLHWRVQSTTPPKGEQH